MKPFIQLFRTPNQCYCFDVNRHEFLAIDEDSYWYLDRLLKSNIDNEDTLDEPQAITDLRASGYLSDESAVKSIKHPYSDYIELFLDRNLGHMTLQLTQDCNLRCKYCIYAESETSRQRSHARKKMNFETAKRAIGFLWDHSVDSSKVNVGFYGGEPLLEFALLQQLVDYCKEVFSGKELSFSITTNGTLLNDEMIYYLEKHNIPLAISLDGIKEVNDKNRVFANGEGTYDVIMKNIQRIKEIAPRLAQNMHVNMVVDPANDYDCFNSACLEGAELDKLVVSPSIVDFDYEDKNAIYSEDYSAKSEYQHFLALLERVNRLKQEDVSPLANSSMGALWDKCLKLQNIPGLHNIDVPSGPCVPGQMRLFVDVAGRFFPCERVSETSPAMCIGSLDDGFDHSSIYNQLNIGALTEDECKKCWCFRHCLLCVKKADDGSVNLSANRKRTFCKGVETAVYSDLMYYLFFKEIPLFYQKQTRIDQPSEGVTI